MLIIPTGERVFAVTGGDGEPLKLPSGEMEGKRDLLPSEKGNIRVLYYCTAA